MTFPVNNFVSADFTVFRELTVNRRQTVDGFYNSVFHPILLTSVIGLRARFNPVGMGFASIRVHSLTRDHLILDWPLQGGKKMTSMKRGPNTMRLYWIVLVAKVAIFMTPRLAITGA